MLRIQFYCLDPVTGSEDFVVVCFQRCFGNLSNRGFVIHNQNPFSVSCGQFKDFCLLLLAADTGKYTLNWLPCPPSYPRL